MKVGGVHFNAMPKRRVAAPKPPTERTSVLIAVAKAFSYKSVGKLPLAKEWALEVVARLRSAGLLD